MRNFRRIIRIVLFVVVGLWLHYVMPQQDIARIVNVDSRITSLSSWQKPFYAQEDTGSALSTTGRDLRLISTERKATYLFGLMRGNNQTMVYRNEDTGWIYPPYFKFDSADLQAEAAASVSTAQPYQWVVVTHYGWRIRWLTVYPNAVAIRPAPSEDFRPFPWVNIVIFALMLAGLLFVRAMWMQFRERTLDPFADRAGDRLDHVNADLAERKGRISRWLDSWRKK